MSDSNSTQINPQVIGWIIGLGVVGIGIFGIGFPLQSRLTEAGASTLVANFGLVIGAFFGFMCILIGTWLIDRYTKTKQH